MQLTVINLLLLRRKRSYTLCLLVSCQVRRREPNQVRRREPARPRTAEDTEVRRRSLPQAPTYSRGYTSPAVRQSNTPPHSPSPRKPVTPRTGQLAAPRYGAQCVCTAYCVLYCKGEWNRRATCGEMWLTIFSYLKVPAMPFTFFIIFKI